MDEKLLSDWRRRKKLIRESCCNSIACMQQQKRSSPKLQPSRRRPKGNGCCLPKTWKPAVKSFTAGGLVPTDMLGNYPEYCNNASHFQISEVKNLSRSMEKYWPSSFDCPSGQSREEVWSHEWKRHGTCSGLSQYQFFNRVIKLITQNNLFKILEDAGIKANGRSYDWNGISDAITRAIHFPGFRCNLDRSGNSQLKQVYLCADPEVTRLVDCLVIQSADSILSFLHSVNHIYSFLPSDYMEEMDYLGCFGIELKLEIIVISLCIWQIEMAMAMAIK